MRSALVGAVVATCAACSGEGTAQSTADTGVVAEATDAREDTSTSVTDSVSDVGGGPLRCGDPGVVLCDGFDDATIDTAKWDREISRGAATLDGARSFRGGRSLHVTLEGGGGRAYLKGRSRVALAGQRLFGRAHLYVPGSAAPTLESHSNIVAFGGSNTAGATVVHAIATGAGSFFGLFFQTDPFVDESSFVRNPGVPITKVPLDRWFCLEWEVDGVANAFRLHLDGALIPSSVLTDRAPAPEADVLVGAEFDLAEVWIDELVLARTRVGCATSD